MSGFFSIDSELFPKSKDDDQYEEDVLSFIGRYQIVIRMLLVSFILTFAGYNNVVLAQDGNVEFDDLQTPASPGFILLDETAELKLDKWGAWISGNFNFNQKVSSTILARYLDNDLADNPENEEADVDNSDGFDLGGRFNWDVTPQICISAEYIQRFSTGSDVESENRIAAIGSFKIMNNLYATATFGKNFGDVQNIIALGGISLGISKNAQTLK